MIKIIPYEEKYAADFKSLNWEWLEKYGLLEQHDIDVLEDPKGMILDNEGSIYFAVNEEEVVGTAALMKEEEGVFELVKMAVIPAWRGKGISKMLMEKCLDTARQKKVKKITLFSHSQLKTALLLYEKYGFRHVKVEKSPYETADVRMELEL
jgi:putative acetyltransferase